MFDSFTQKITLAMAGKKNPWGSSGNGGGDDGGDSDSGGGDSDGPRNPWLPGGGSGGGSGDADPKAHAAQAAAAAAARAFVCPSAPVAAAGHRSCWCLPRFFGFWPQASI